MLIPEMLPRGKLILDFVNLKKFDSEILENFIQKILDSSHEYNAFNLIVGNLEHLSQIYYVDIFCCRKIRLKRGYLYGFSNNLFMYSVSSRVRLAFDRLEVNWRMKRIKLNLKCMFKNIVSLI